MPAVPDATNQTPVMVDADQDGLPDIWDDHPSDPANNSFYFDGGQFTVHGIYHAFRSGWYSGHTSPDTAGSTFDGGNPVPAVLMSWFDPNSSHAEVSLQTWAGAFIFINGQFTSLPGVQHWAAGIVDADEDDIPEEFDPDDHDPWNGTYYWFPGGEFWIDGVWTALPGATYPGLVADGDGDGIPDPADRHSSDPNNNSIMWPGGSLYCRGAYYGPLPARMHQANASDSDNDGLPDDIDPWPSFDDNWPRFWFPGGTYRINNQDVPFAGAWLEGSTAFVTAITDSDGDNLPDSLDDYPNDSNNGNTTGGGDPPPSSIHWNGGEFRIDGVLRTFYEGDYPDADADADTIPDATDPWPYDENNNSLSWSGLGTLLMIDDVPQQVPADGSSVWIPANSPDPDGDGLPSAVDPYPEDATNNHGFFWPTPTMLGNKEGYENQYVARIMNGDWPFYPTHFGKSDLNADGSMADQDEDGIPDSVDPLPGDKYNQNDTDGDGIPDSTEVMYPTVLSMINPDDAALERSDGVTYLQAWYFVATYGQPRPLDQPFTASDDVDGDGIGDAYEMRYGLNPVNPEDAAFTRTDGDENHPISLYDPYVLNRERAAAGVPLTEAITSEEAFTAITGQFWYELQSHADSRASAEADWDGDGISNRDELLLLGTSPRVFNAVIDNASSVPPPDLPADTMRNVLTQGVTLTSGNVLYAGSTTLTNFSYLITPCTCGRSDGQGGFCEGLHCVNVKNPGNCGCHPVTACQCQWATNGSNLCTTCTSPENFCSGNCYTPPQPCTCSSSNNCPHDTSCAGCGSNCDFRTASCGCGCTKGSSCPNASTTNPPASTADCSCSVVNNCQCANAGCEKGTLCSKGTCDATTVCSDTGATTCDCVYTRFAPDGQPICKCSGKKCANDECAACACQYSSRGNAANPSCTCTMSADCSGNEGQCAKCGCPNAGNTCDCSNMRPDSCKGNGTKCDCPGSACACPSSCSPTPAPPQCGYSGGLLAPANCRPHCKCPCGTAECECGASEKVANKHVVELASVDAKVWVNGEQVTVAQVSTLATTIATFVTTGPPPAPGTWGLLLIAARNGIGASLLSNGTAFQLEIIVNTQVNSVSCDGEILASSLITPPPSAFVEDEAGGDTLYLPLWGTYDVKNKIEQIIKTTLQIEQTKQ
ncbi:MAG: hypothetical protein JNM99_08550 [Verrucomicrobiaceae bacterium]|nr:hypothetical protein [Verrucomicrobiaceae bacterium]